MKILRDTTICFFALIPSLSAQADMQADPVLAHVILDKVENRFTEGEDTWVVETDAWLGKDLHKAWFKLDSEHTDGNPDSLELQALYSRAIAPYWDLQLGWSHLRSPKPGRDAMVIGFRGQAPYHIEIDTAALISAGGQVELRFEAEYELNLTQRWVLTPQVEFTLHSKDEFERDITSGFSEIEFGLRLSVEIRREFSPYLGINWTRHFGDDTDLIHSPVDEKSDWQLVAGLRAWF